MRPLIILLAVIFLSGQAYAQNIIPNANWELGPTVSTNYTDGWVTNGPDDWTTTNLSPDRIYEGSVTPFRDGDTAQLGKAYVMFYGPTNESGKCLLNTPVVAGTKYHLTYYLNVDDNFDGGSGAIVFYFIDGDSITTHSVVNTGAWQYFDTTFTASKNADSLKLIGIGHNLTEIDNISLTVNGQSSTKTNIRANNLSVNIYPNPLSNKGIIKITGANNINNSQLSIFNVFGQVLMQISVNSSQFAFQKQDIPAGLYFYTLQGPAGEVTFNGKLIVE